MDDVNVYMKKFDEFCNIFTIASLSTCEASFIPIRIHIAYYFLANKYISETNLIDGPKLKLKVDSYKMKVQSN